ncbi:MAG: hypothetical protein MUC87_22210 [Bacteroidia bacterium]|jgi:hypothetical protein|nr:hypothetical protein [Bacteroidia bacterium]
MHPLLQKLTASPRAAAIELVAGGETLCANVVVVKRRRQKLELEAHEINISSEEQLKKAVPQGVPVIALLSGKGVLHRVVQSGAQETAVLLHKVLPNATVADFLVQAVPAANGQQLVSVIRRTAAEEQLNTLCEPGFAVTACTLGAAAAAELIPVLHPAHPAAWQLGNHRITWNAGQIAALESTEAEAGSQTVDLGGTVLPLAALPAFAAAVQWLSGTGHARVNSDELQTAAADFQQRRLFRVGGLTLLAVTLCILIGNYLAFSHYWEKKAALEEEVQLNGNLLDQVRALQKQTEMRRYFLDKNGIRQAGKHSFFADRLAAGLPEALTLTRLAIAPREKLQREDTIAFQPGIILVEGECAQSVLLNDWINRLNTETWIAKASLRNYAQPGNRKTGQFEVEIQLGE